MEKITKIRLPYIDIAKGILISLLIVHHTIDYYLSYCNVQNVVVDALAIIQKPLILCYFMQAFFVITGMCSNFTRDFKTFIWQQVKTLMIPAFLVGIILNPMDIKNVVISTILSGGLYWFLTALFCSKIIYWILFHYVKNKRVILLILFILSFCGLLLHTYKPTFNLWYVTQTCDLTLFLAVGSCFKSILLKNKTFVVSIILFLICVSLCYVTGINLPYLTAGSNLTFANYPIHLVLAATGTILVLNISKYIKNSPLLIDFGKKTLSIYLFQRFILMALTQTFGQILNTDSALESTIVLVATFCTAMVLLKIIADVVNMKYLKWILGKY